MLHEHISYSIQAATKWFFAIFPLDIHNSIYLGNDFETDSAGGEKIRENSLESV